MISKLCTKIQEPVAQNTQQAHTKNEATTSSVHLDKTMVQL
jgi:hypothetical protein